MFWWRLWDWGSARARHPSSQALEAATLGGARLEGARLEGVGGLPPALPLSPPPPSRAPATAIASLPSRRPRPAHRESISTLWRSLASAALLLTLLFPTPRGVARRSCIVLSCLPIHSLPSVLLPASPAFPVPSLSPPPSGRDGNRRARHARRGGERQGGTAERGRRSCYGGCLPRGFGFRHYR